MQELTVANIEKIIDEVSRAGITISHLHDELIDHICCHVENEMQSGLSFDKAFDKVKSLIGNKGLKKVQEDTLLLINKKYRFMKNTMKNFGMVSLLLITVGALFEIQHWAGAGIMLCLGFLLLIAVFFPSALWVMKKESKLKGSLFIYIISIIGGINLMLGFLFKIQHYPGAGIELLFGYTVLAAILIPAILIALLRDKKSKNLRAAYIIGAVSLMYYLIGQLFKFQHYPGASIMLIIGTIGITAIFLPLYSYKVFRNTENVKAGFIFICFGIFFLNLYSFLLALNISKDVFNSSVVQGEEILKTTNLLASKNIRLYNKLITDSSSCDTLKTNVKNLREISDELCNYIENIKVVLIEKTDGIPNEEAAKNAKDIYKIIAKDNSDIPMLYMMGQFNDGKAIELKLKIEKFKTKLLSISHINDTEKNIILKSLDTQKEIVDNVGTCKSWEFANFYHVPLISAENTLSSIQRNVRISEGEVLESLVCFADNNTEQLYKKSNIINK